MSSEIITALIAGLFTAVFNVIFVAYLFGGVKTSLRNHAQEIERIRDHMDRLEERFNSLLEKPPKRPRSSQEADRQARRRRGD